jgi:hypothetical protein
MKVSRTARRVRMRKASRTPRVRIVWNSNQRKEAQGKANRANKRRIVDSESARDRIF